MNSLTIEPVVNAVTIESMINAVTVVLFDVYTTTYFLSEAMTLEDHKEVE
jgi:hypothetical protein